MSEEKKITKDGEVVILPKKRKFLGQTFTDPKKDDIITYKVKNYIVKTGEGPDDFVVKQKMIVAERVNRSSHINSFSGDVGIQNVLKKVALSGQDITSVVDSGKFYSHQKGLVDISKMPDNIVEAYEAVEKGVKAFDKLPPELRKKASFAKFAEEIKNSDISEFIRSEADRYNAMLKKAQVKKESKKEDK